MESLRGCADAQALMPDFANTVTSRQIQGKPGPICEDEAPGTDAQLLLVYIMIFPVNGRPIRWMTLRGCTDLRGYELGGATCADARMDVLKFLFARMFVSARMRGCSCADVCADDFHQPVGRCDGILRSYTVKI